VLAQGYVQISCGRYVPVFGTGHGKNFTVYKIMTFGLRGLPCQVVGSGKCRFGSSVAHGELRW
jgi:hypothetical protein